jgi:serpin B
MIRWTLPPPNHALEADAIKRAAAQRIVRQQRRGDASARSIEELVVKCSRCGKTNFDWAKKCDHCGETFEDSGNVQSLRTRPSEPASFAAENNDFALAMYGQLRRRPGNLFFSPFSIRTGLGMTQAGARGETAAQMKEALRISSSDDTVHVAFAETILRLDAASGGKYEMAVANSLWGQDGAPLQPGFLDLIARHYGGGMNVVDFRHAAEAARLTINRWVEDKTKQKIRELVPSGRLDANARLVLVNAVHFKGMWVLQFRKAATRDEPFYLEGGDKVQAPLMHHQQQEVRYLRAGDFQAVDLDYRGGDLSMLVLLPSKKDGLRDLETKLSPRMLHECVAKMRVRELEFFLPRFRMAWGTVELAARGTSDVFKRTIVCR